MSLGTFSVMGRDFVIVEATLTCEFDDVGGCISIFVGAEPDCGFGLMDVQMMAAMCIDDLDGKRLHASSDGKSFEDDSLITDMVGSDMSDIHVVATEDDRFGIAEAIVDFSQVAPEEFKCVARIRYFIDDDEIETAEAAAQFTVQAKIEGDR